MSKFGKNLLAGAYSIDITPASFPVIVNGGFLEKIAPSAQDRLHARSLVLDDGATRVAIVIVDSTMLPRELIDAVKDTASNATGIPVDRMLIAATHTHGAPASMGALGSGEDVNYAQWLPGRIAESIRLASERVEPARIGWSVAADWQHTNCRRWITRSDKMLEDPFGVTSVRAMMHPGYQNPDYVGPAGPIDPDLWLLAVQAIDGRPIGLLANYSMHYFGAIAVSADYYGKFAEGIGSLIGERRGGPPFVGMMSQGTSGDSHWMDYSQPKRNEYTIAAYTKEVLNLAAATYSRIQFQDWVPLSMAEVKLSLRRRVPDGMRMAWAREIVATMAERAPSNKTEVYAREQLFLKESPQRELKLQALRIGDLGITAMPCEAFAITGLKLKALSPLHATFNIGLANGAEGYIPPIEQHKLGGYATWAARTAGLEVTAERKIVQTLLRLLEKVSGKRRRKVQDTHGPYAKAVLEGKPFAYWRLNEFGPPTAFDATENARHAKYEDGVAYYLLGAQTHSGGISTYPDIPSSFSGNQVNRAPHFAGGRVRASVDGLGASYSVALWIWNGLAKESPLITSYFLFRESGERKGESGDYLGLGGAIAAPGRVFFTNDTVAGKRLFGNTQIAPRTWNYVVLVRGTRSVRVYLNGQAHPEIHAEECVWPSATGSTLCIGGQSDDSAGFQGKLGEVSVYDRELSIAEIARHYRLACGGEYGAVNKAIA
ncbi:MAG: hypothetical protein IH606_03470 [Burkholderiales bacterium]|nr:hypothetical protein [Burkholderiales bacterium]